MDVVQKDPVTAARQERADLAELLRPGVLVVDGGRSGSIAFVDTRALELLGCADQAALEQSWSELRGRLQSADAGSSPGSSPDNTLDVAGRRLTFDWRQNGGGGVLLVHDAVVAESLTADLCQASLLRSISQITPAVAHDLRAPINAMVFNIEVLKETIAAGKGAEPAGREKQLRYVNVLRDELHRLHQGMETYIAQISPRGDRDETFDLRELLTELATLLVGPARKGQARVVCELPPAPVTVTGNRYRIRQALLHVAVAALAGVPRDSALEICLERRKGRAVVRLGAEGSSPAAGAQAAQEPGGFGVSASPGGTQAQLWSARSILAGLGGAARALKSETETPLAYEVELAVTQDLGSQEKE
jgi:signal transduction histidine kinase